jgi:hypothetical protein
MYWSDGWWFSDVCIFCISIIHTIIQRLVARHTTTQSHNLVYFSSSCDIVQKPATLGWCSTRFRTHSHHLFMSHFLGSRPIEARTIYMWSLIDQSYSGKNSEAFHHMHVITSKPPVDTYRPLVDASLPIPFMYRNEHTRRNCTYVSTHKLNIYM